MPDSLPVELQSADQLRQAFATGLGEMLDADVLGGFILVLANACHDGALFERLAQPLRAAHDRWCDRFDRDDPLALNAAADDVDVFRQVRALGLDALPLTAWRDVGVWRLQFNALRALRPPRNSQARIQHLQRPFDAAGFHFNKPFLRREIFWQGRLAGTPVRLLYNKFPFAEMHGLLVPEPDACHAQFLTRTAHMIAWSTLDALASALPGVGLGFNAIGALASVNHLHFQMFVNSDRGYPVESASWRHNGGQREYPLPVRRFDDPAAAWEMIEALHAREQAYNLVYRPGLVYVVPRAMQGSYRQDEWTAGFAWSEIAGVITLFDESVFSSLDVQAIERAFAQIRPQVG